MSKISADSNVNKHGLSRHIPSEIRRTIRQGCGFGCVICGAALYQYEHINPEFQDAVAHDPARMALLCAQCHDKVTRRRLSKESVDAARKNPKCLQQGYTRDFLACGDNGEILLNLGPIVTIGCKRILRILGDDVLWVNPPEVPGGPARLNAMFQNAGGEAICEIVDNEIRVRKTNWDVEIVGPELTIRNGAGDIALVFRSEAGHSMRIERLRMRHRSVEVLIQKDGLLEFGASNTFRQQLSGSMFFHTESCVEVFQDHLRIGGNSILRPGTM